MNLKLVQCVKLFLLDLHVRIKVIDMLKPIVWHLDVDGVINASRAGWSAAPKSGWAYANGQQWRMRWSPQLIQRIIEVHNTGSVEIKWATTWVGYTDQLQKLFRLPDLISAGSESMSVSMKRQAAEDVVDSGRKLIWTDDVAVPIEGALLFKLEAFNSLLIRPKSNRGLRPEHLDMIDEYVLRYGS